MRNYFKKLPLKLKEVVNQAAKVSLETKMPAYLVGGCLRDLILNVKNLDLDIAIEGSGIIFAQRLAKKLKSTLKIHPRFGTATLVLDDGLKVDIATARREDYPYSAALPVVSPGMLREDLKRRDFTINALAISLAKDKPQKIIDLFGGQDDLVLGRIRILHNLSFKDDPTRIFRAIRFSQRYDFKIESKTKALLKQSISEGALDKVSLQRMRDELIGVLKEQNPFKSIKQLGDLGALSFIGKKLKIGKSTQRLFKSIAYETAWFAKDFPEHRQPDTWLVYLMALLEPFTYAQIKRITYELSLRRVDRKRIVGYYQKRKKLIACLSKPQTPEQVFSLLEPVSYEAIILLRAISKNKNLRNYLVVFLKLYNGLRLCISGRDLGNLGVSPGPEYKKLLAKVLKAKLNGQVVNRQTELALIKKLVKAK